MPNRKTALQFILYRGERETYYRYYQNTDGTFSRVTTDVTGRSTWVNYYPLSEVARQVFDAALLGYHVADLKAFPASSVARLHEEIAKGVFQIDED